MCQWFYFFPALYVFCALSVIIGFFIYLKPEKAIRIQIVFYRQINWIMQPVSMEKEVRHTKAMGLFLMMAALGAIIAILLKTRL